MLKRLLALAICRPSEGEVQRATVAKGPSNNINNIAPTRFRMKWPAATLRPADEAWVDAMTAVTHVPMLAPSMKAMAPSSAKAPVPASAIIIARLAPEDWRTAVAKVPARRLNHGRASTEAARDSLRFPGETLLVTVSIATNTIASPTKDLPKHPGPLLPKRTIRPRPRIARGTDASKEPLAIICGVRVVPTLAPAMMARACLRLRTPESANPTTATDTMLDDCSTPVATVPKSAPRKGLPKTRVIICFDRLPETPLKPETTAPRPTNSRPIPISNPGRYRISRTPTRGYAR